MESGGWRGNVLGEGWCQVPQTPGGRPSGGSSSSLLTVCLSRCPLPAAPALLGSCTLLFAPLRWSQPPEPQLRSSPASQLHPSPVTAASSHHHLAPDLISPLPAEAGDPPLPLCHQVPPCHRVHRCHRVPPCHQDVPGAVASPRAGAGPPSPRRSAAEQSRAGQPTLPLHSQTTSLCHEDIY